MRFIYTKTFAVFFICLGIVACLLFLEAKGWLSPVRTTLVNIPKPVVSAFNHTAGPAKSFFTVLLQLKRINQENISLRQQVFDLKNSLVQAEQQKTENETLRSELGFARTSKYKLTSCTVLSKNSFGIADTLILNCGSEQGVEADQAIMAQGYLVGKILFVSSKVSTAVLITSSKFSTDGKLNKNGTEGLVKGSFGSGIILEQIPQNAAIGKGDSVVTAGINPKIPKNILIGEVGDTLSNTGDLLKITTVVSPINFNNLEFVFAVK